LLGEYEYKGMHGEGRRPYSGGDFGPNSYPMRFADPAAPSRDPYVAFAIRWWWLLLIGAVLGTAVAFAYTTYGPTPYESSAMAQVSPPAQTDPTENTSQASRAASSFAAEASSPRMFELVSRALGAGVSARDLSEMEESGAIEIEDVNSSNLVSITARDPDPERARALADTIATVFVNDVNARARARLDVRMEQLEQQIQVTRDRLATAQLQAREMEIRRELADQRTLLLQLQLSYQQELQRQSELRERTAEGRDGAPSEPVPQLARLQAEWQRIVSQQIKDVERNLSELAGALRGVRKSLAQLPPSSDPTISAALSSAYGAQLQSVTQNYAELQLTGQETTAPLTRYGNASEPSPTSGGMKTLIMGLAAGAALAGGIGFAFDMLRKRRRAGQILETAPAPDGVIGVPELIERLERLGLASDTAGEYDAVPGRA
jgi:capsular polysaccharide biosynthesis protein